MKLPFNLRVPIIIVIALICGITLGFYVERYNLNPAVIAAIVPATAAIFILSLIFLRGKRAIYFILIICLTVFAGTLNCYIRFEKYSENRISDGAAYNITAVVVEKGTTASGEYLILGNVKAGGIKINGKVKAYLGATYGDYCEDGYKVNFTAALKKADAFAYGKLTSNAAGNITYTCSVYGNLTAKYRFSVFGSIRSAVRNTLFENLDSDTAATALAMLTGNTQSMESEVLTSFRYGGIAHVFAVSGLHIGIIYGIAYMLMKALRLNKYAAATICILTLFFYAGICGFTLSSIRAAIMCSVGMLTKLIHKKYDSLNSLAVSVFLILFITPLSLFSVGFQLSVCAVLGIALLSRRISNSLRKLPKKLSETVGVSLSAQAGTMPVMLASFGYLSGFGLILNLIFVPILSAIFVLLFVGTFISLILPFSAAFLLPAAAAPFETVISFFVNAGFERALVRGFGSGIVILLYYIMIFALSDKLNARRLQRITAVICSAAVLCGCVSGQKFSPVKNCKIIVSASYGGGQVLVKSGTESVLILTGEINLPRTLTLLNDNYITNLSSVILLGDENYLFDYDTEIPCKNIYVYASNIGVQPFKDVRVNYANFLSAGNATLTFGNETALLIECGGTETAVCAGTLNPFENCDLIISDYATHNGLTVSFNRLGNDCNVFDNGTFSFKISNGKICDSGGLS